MTDTNEETNPSGEEAQNDAPVETANAGESSSAAPLDKKESTANSTTGTSDAVESTTAAESPTTETALPRVSPSPPPRPPKRARTAYFIFADSVRQEVQQDHQGVAAQAKAIGAKWKTLEEPQGFGIQ